MSRGITRRKAIVLGSAAVLSACAHRTTHARSIRSENARPGTRDWLLSNTRIDPGTKYRCPWIEGYCSHTSVRAGERISFHVSTNPASPFRLEIYRMGFYRGAGGRLVHSAGSFQGQ